jgi:hypothetical protein
MASKGFDENVRKYYSNDEEWANDEYSEDYCFEISNNGFTLLYESYGGSGPMGPTITINELLTILDKKVDMIHYLYHQESDCGCTKDDAEKTSNTQFDQWIRDKVQQWSQS